MNWGDHITTPAPTPMRVNIQRPFEEPYTCLFPPSPALPPRGGKGEKRALQAPPSLWGQRRTGIGWVCSVEWPFT